MAEGIDRQVSRTRKLIEARGWTVAGDYRDNDTSASKDRSIGTRWAAMLADAEAGKFDVVVAVDIDRLLRSMPDLVSLTATGVAVLTVDGEIDLTTADGEFRATMLTGIARFETRRKGERQKRANDARVAQGKPVPGRRRYGYESDNMTPREDEAKLVRWAFDQIKAGGSIRSTAITMNIRPVRLREMLTNAAYKGMVKHKGVFLPSTAVTPLVPGDLFDEVGAILTDPARKTSPGSAVKWVATGIATCGVCGAKLQHTNGYICSAATNHVYITSSVLDARIAEEVFMWVVEHPEAEENAVSADLTALLSESAAIARQRAQVQEVAMMDGADMALIRKQLGDISKRADAIQQRINAERAAASRGGLVEAVRGEWWALRDERPWGPEEEEALAAWPAYWSALGLDKQREAVRSTFRIIVNKGRNNFERVVFEEV
ncbi:recombinase family protein [Herbiconiux sp. 11R-BC]|uniref:recombinase family protein n=1 Tax=Herbiconiux sp. 11R-BC TaxID=3111637 RepID=UPI003C0BF725